jgi:hypothetical protein
VLGLNIDFDSHALKRLIKRSCYLGIDQEEAFIRVRETLAERHRSKTKYSKHNDVYYKYYHDNISFFVIVHKQYMCWIIKTVIMKRGRE